MKNRIITRHWSSGATKINKNYHENKLLMHISIEIRTILYIFFFSPVGNEEARRERERGREGERKREREREGGSEDVDPLAPSFPLVAVF